MDKHIISWAEQIYHQSKTFPSPRDFHEGWPKTFPDPSTAQSWLSTAVVKQALHNRGLNPSQNPNSTQLSEVQAAAILAVANLSDRRALSSKLKSIGVTLTQWNAWKKQANFRSFLYSQLNDDLDSSLDRAFSGLLNAVDKGDSRAIQIYLELTGRQPTENERNYRLAVSRIVESIQRHVKDPETIAKLAADFDSIEAGRDPSQLLSLEPIQPQPTHWIEQDDIKI
jgi:hypothetical protein